MSYQSQRIFTMPNMFMMMMMMLVCVNGHVCDSGWSAYVPSSSSHAFAVVGCDAVYDELIKKAFPKDNCSFLSVLEKESVCLTTKDDLQHAGTCRSPGLYGFDATVVVKCPSGVQRWKTAVIGAMKNGMISFKSMEHFPMSWSL